VTNCSARILALLPAWPSERCPGTRDVVSGIGQSGTRVSVASMSRTLRRLAERGLVVAAHSQIANRDRRVRWARPPAAAGAERTATTPGGDGAH